MADYTLKQHDTFPSFDATLTDSLGAAINLTGSTVRVYMSSGATLINGSCTIVSPTAGTVTYTWVTGDTNTIGDYNVEWEITYGSGAIETVPNDGYKTLKIIADLH